MGTKLTVTSELLESFKPFRIASSEKKMMAVHTKEMTGFLSIGDDGKLYLTYQKDGESSGWARKQMAQQLMTGDLRADTFALVYDELADREILILSLTGKENKLYLSQSFSLLNEKWQEIPLPEGYTIRELFLSSYQQQLYVTADLDKNGYLNRFYINTDEQMGEKWRYYPIPCDFHSISSNCIGRPEKHMVNGVYTLGEIAGSRQLIYVPDYNVYDPEIMPTPIRLQVFEGVESIASCKKENTAYTHLFACGAGAMCIYPAQEQKDLAKPIRLAESEHFRNIRQMYAYNSGQKAFVWILNESRNLLCLHADAGRVSEPDAWSPVFLMYSGLDYVDAFQNGDVRTLLGYLADGNGIIGEESKETGLWTFRKIYLPASGQKPQKIKSYVTRITACNEEGNPLPSLEVRVRASQPCSAFAGNVCYYFKNNEILLKTDENGTIKLVQSASTPIAVQFTVSAADGPKITVDPSAGVTDRIYNLNSQAALRNARIKKQSGQEELLVLGTVKASSLEAAGAAIGKLKEADAGLRGKAYAPNSGVSIVRLCMTEGNLCLKDPLMEANEWNMQAQEQYSPQEVFALIRAQQLSSMEHHAGTADQNNFFDIIIGWIDDAWKFMVKIGEKIISFIIDCVEKAAACVVEVFELIKVAVEKVIEFLQFIFDMEDIIKTKEIMVHLLNVGMNDLKAEMGGFKTLLHGQIQMLIELLKDLGDLEDIGELGSQSPGQLQEQNNQRQPKDVKSNYLNDLYQENRENAVLHMPNELTELIDDAQSSIIDELLASLEQIIERDREIIEELINRIKAEFIDGDKYKNMDMLTFIKKLFAIGGIAVLEVGEQIVDILVDILIQTLDSLQKMLNYEFYIPGVTEFLEYLGIPRFSLLDIFAFLCSFFGNAFYKLFAGKALISDPVYQSLKEIKSLKDLSAIKDTRREGSNAQMGIAGQIQDYAQAPSLKREIYCVCKILCGVVASMETVIAIPLKADAEQQDSNILLVFAALDGVFYIAAGFAEKPFADRVPLASSAASYAFTVIKYLPMAVVGYGVLKKSDKIKLAGRGAYAVTSLLTALVVDVIYLVQAGKASTEGGGGRDLKKEKKIYQLDTSGLILDNLRNTMDFCLYLPFAKHPVVRTVMVIARTCFAGGYAGLEISTGIIGTQLPDEKGEPCAGIIGYA